MSETVCLALKRGKQVSPSPNLPGAQSPSGETARHTHNCDKICKVEGTAEKELILRQAGTWDPRLSAVTAVRKHPNELSGQPDFKK